MRQNDWGPRLLSVRRVITLCCLIAAGNMARSQVNSDGGALPASFRPEIRPAIFHLLPPLGADEISQLAESGGAALVAVRRSIERGVMAAATCDAVPGAGYLWRLAIRSPGARAIGFHFTNFFVGAGRVWLHNGDREHPQVVGPYSGAGILGDGDFQSAMIFSEEVVIEYENAGQEACFGDPPFQVAQLIHVWGGRSTGAGVRSAGISGPAPRDTVGFQCIANAVVPPTARAESLAEPFGDYLLSCNGGTPTPAGVNIPQTNLTLMLSTPVTSRLLGGGGSEVLLLADEPPANRQLMCASLSGCAITGATGPGTPYDGSPGRPNIFQGVVSGNAITFYGVPVDQPGTLVTRVFHITEVRGNAYRRASGSVRNAGTGIGFTPGQ